MKRLFLALVCTLPLIVGCSMDSAPGGGSAATTTLYGSLQPPALNATAMIGGSRRAAVRGQSGYNTGLLADFSENGICKVNGKIVPFSLNTGDSSFKITGLEPFGAYEVRFELASFSLRATKPYTGIQVNMGTVNLTSTAKSYIYEAYQATIRQIQDYEILDENVAPLVAKLAEWLNDDETTPAAFDDRLTAELGAITGQKHLDEISKFTGNDMSGTWTGQGTLCTKTLTGLEAQKAVVNLTLHVVREADELSGYVNVEVVSTTKVNNGGIIPVTGRREFTAKVDTEGRFTFQVYRDPNTPVERWSFTLDNTDALVCTVQSLHEQGLQSYADNLPKLRP